MGTATQGVSVADPMNAAMMSFRIGGPHASLVENMLWPFASWTFLPE
jgi:hypothetical protein